MNESLPKFNDCSAGSWLLISETVERARRESPPSGRCQEVSDWLESLVEHADEDDCYLQVLAGIMFQVGMLNHISAPEDSRFSIKQLALDLQERIDTYGVATWDGYSNAQISGFFLKLGQEARRTAISLSLIPHS